VPSNVIKRAHAHAHATRLGRPLGPPLAPPRAIPRLGGAAVLCVVPVRASLPCCSFVYALRELGLRLGVKAPLPLRASSRGVLPGAGALAGYRTPIQPRFARRDSCLSFRAPGLQIGYDALSPTQDSPRLLLVLTEVARSGR
jgi:hypothetical protein